jgi:hypothetical protein
VQLFLIAFQRPVEFGVAAAISILMVLIVLRSAMAADGRARWVRSITSPNARIVFALLFVAWALVFGVGLQLVPHEGANSPYGGLGLIALFTGFFISMGFLWSVIGD